MELNFEEFNSRIGQTIYVSATPNEYELNLSGISINILMSDM